MQTILAARTSSHANLVTASKPGLTYLWLACSTDKLNGLHPLDILDLSYGITGEGLNYFFKADGTAEAAFIFAGSFPCPQKRKQI